MLATLAEIYAEDLASENVESISAAFAMHRRRSTRFPTPAHILAILPECRVLPKLEALPQMSSGRKTPGIGKLAYGALKGDMEAEKALKKRFVGKLSKKAARP